MSALTQADLGPQIALRIKGYCRPVEGRLIDDQDMILILEKDDSVLGAEPDVIEAVWFLCQWMSPERFMSLQ